VETILGAARTPSQEVARMLVPWLAREPWRERAATASAASAGAA